MQFLFSWNHSGFRKDMKNITIWVFWNMLKKNFVVAFSQLHICNQCSVVPISRGVFTPKNVENTPHSFSINCEVYGMSPESYEKIRKENFLLLGIHSLV